MIMPKSRVSVEQDKGVLLIIYLGCGAGRRVCRRVDRHLFVLIVSCQLSDQSQILFIIACRCCEWETEGDREIDEYNFKSSANSCKCTVGESNRSETSLM